MISIDCILVEDRSEVGARVTVTVSRLFVEIVARGIFKMFSRDWTPYMDVGVNEPLDISLDSNGEHVIITGGGETVRIYSKSIFEVELIEEIRRNIDIARNLSKNNSFSSKEIIYNLKKERASKGPSL